jgi:hypothetical protein
MAMCRSTTELLVREGKKLELVFYEQETGSAKKKAEQVELQPLLLHSGRALPVPMGVLVERKQMGGISTSDRSSDILNLVTLAVILLTQIYKQILPDLAQVAREHIAYDMMLRNVGDFHSILLFALLFDNSSLVKRLR